VNGDITLVQGKTFSDVLRWEQPVITYKPITAIAQTAPVRITVPTHGVPSGWRVAITGVKGMAELNAEANAVKPSDYHSATVIDADTLELNDINAASFKPYVSGGILQYNTPVDLTGYTARMSIKDKVGGTLLLTPALSIDTAAKTITRSIDAVTTAAIAWKSGVYDLEMVAAGGQVYALIPTSKVTVTREVTT
jgi:hypothetical protein